MHFYHTNADAGTEFVPSTPLPERAQAVEIVEIILWCASAVETRQRFTKASAILPPTLPHKMAIGATWPKMNRFLKELNMENGRFGATTQSQNANIRIESAPLIALALNAHTRRLEMRAPEK